MRAGDGEPPTSDALSEFMRRQGFEHSNDVWVRTRAVTAAPMADNDDVAAERDATPPKSAASAAAQQTEDKRSADAHYRSKERAEDARSGISQCVLRLSRPLHPPLQAMAAEAREPGGSRTVVAIAALAVRPEWREIIYHGELHADRVTLIEALSAIVTSPALRRIVCALAKGAAGLRSNDLEGLEALIEGLFAQPAQRDALFDRRIRELCLAIAADQHAIDLLERILADPDRRMLDAATRLPQADRALIQALLNLDGGARRALLVAARIPGLAHAIARAAESTEVRDSIVVAANDPATSCVGQTVLQARGIVGWIARQAVARLAQKQRRGTTPQ